MWIPVFRIVLSLVRQLFLFAFFLLIPVMVTIGLSWFVYSFTKGTPYFTLPWMMPSLLGISAFIGGILIRIKADQEKHGLFVLLSGAMAQLGFALLSWIDLQVMLYSSYLPHSLQSPLPVVFALPCLSMLGFLSSGLFRIRS